MSEDSLSIIYKGGDNLEHKMKRSEGHLLSIKHQERDNSKQGGKLNESHSLSIKLRGKLKSEYEKISRQGVLTGYQAPKKTSEHMGRKQVRDTHLLLGIEEGSYQP